MRLRADFKSGTLTSGITNVATSLASTELAGLAEVVSPDYLMVVLDPLGGAGAPEVVKVTAHSAGATTATVVRAQEGSAARPHLAGVTWRHTPTATDWGALTDLHVNVKKEFLALGDGTTNDATAINNALAKTGVGTIFLPAGVFEITSTLACAQADVTVVGIPGKSLIRRNYSPYLTVTSAPRFTMRDVSLLWKAGDTNQTDWVQVSGSTDVLFERVTWDLSSATTNAGNAINATSNSDRLAVVGCRMLLQNGSTNRAFSGVIVTDCEKVLIERNYIKGGRSRGVDIRSATGQSTKARVLDNIIEDQTLQGVLSWNGYTIVRGNQIDGTGNYGIFLTGEPGTGTTNNHSVVQGNVVTDCAGGIDLEYDVHHANIQGNQINSPTGNGISMIRDISDIHVDGNQILGAAGSYGGIACITYGGGSTSSRIFVRGNSVRGSTNSGIYLEDGAASYIGGANNVTGNTVGITLGAQAAVTWGENILSGNTSDYSGGGPATYSITNAATDRAYDANATTVDELADAFATRIAEDRARGLVR